MSLQTEKVTVHGNWLEIQSSHFKTIGPAGLPRGVLRLSKRPDLLKVVSDYVMGRRMEKSKMLFDSMDS